MIILIGGGSGAGKTTLAQSIDSATIVHMDDFHHPRETWPDIPYFADHPDAIAIGEIVDTINHLVAGHEATIYPYSPLDGKRHEPRLIIPNQNLVVEGLFALHYPELLTLDALRLYVDCPAGVREERRIVRDYAKGRNKEQSLAWSVGVDAMHGCFVENTREYAHFVISGQESYYNINQLIRSLR